MASSDSWRHVVVTEDCRGCDSTSIQCQVCMTRSRGPVPGKAGQVIWVGTLAEEFGEVTIEATPYVNPASSTEHWYHVKGTGLLVAGYTELVMGTAEYIQQYLRDLLGFSIRNFMQRFTGAGETVKVGSKDMGEVAGRWAAGEHLLAESRRSGQTAANASGDNRGETRGRRHARRGRR